MLVSSSFSRAALLGGIHYAPKHLHMVSGSNSLQPSSAAGAFAKVLPNRARPGRNGRHSLRLLAAAGVLAFLFSAASPYDDSIQQEFVRIRKSAQSSVLSWRVVHSFAVAEQPLSVIRLSSPVPVRDTLERAVDDSSSSLPQMLSASPVGERPPPFLHS